jgi:hypothetical protein
MLLKEIITVYSDSQYKTRKFVWGLDAQKAGMNFHSCTVHLDTIKVFYLPTDT